MPPFTKYFFPVLLLASLVTAPATEAPKDDYIDWSPKKLEWSDYQSKPDPESDAAATTTTYLGVEYKVSGNQFQYRIACRFSKEKSWGLHRTAYILAHEQGHFDITEIFARRLNQRLSEYRFNKRTFEKDLKRIYDRVMKEKEEFQNRYDHETDFSRNRKVQYEWLDRIGEILSETEEWGGYPRISE
ncbi:MAG TPA: DUF922 domain-containing protein [Chitinophagaceae bacterium]|nr:DUF922 domain-containing protein [Chitinophagaceae bacterium]